MRESMDSVFNARLKPTVFRLTKRKEKPALEGRHYPLQKPIPSEEIIYDPETDTNRTIRYAQGETSVFKDEQPQKVVRGDIIFQNGTLRVPHTEPTLLKFLELSNLNAGNPNRRGKKVLFEKVDNNATAKKAMDIEVEQITAANAVLQMEFSKLKGYARILGVNTNNSADMIRHDMLVLAKADPKGFLDGIDDPVNEREQVVLDAATYGIIEIAARSISWKIGDKKSLIVPVPVGVKASKWFAEWTLSEKDGETVFKEIQKKAKAFNSED